MAQVFLHYVNQKGPFKHHAYDTYNKNTGKKSSAEDKIILRKNENKNK